MLDDFFKSERWETARMFIALFLVLAAAFLFAINIDVVGAGLGAVLSALQPFIIGAAVAYVLNLLMVKLERIYFPKSDSALVHKTRRPVSLLLSVGIILAVFSLVSYFVASELASAITAIGDGIIAVSDWLKGYVSEDSYFYAVLNGEPGAWSTYLQDLINALGGTDDVTTSITVLGTNIATGTLNAVVAFVFALYVLMDKENVLAGLHKACRWAVPDRFYPGFMHVGRVANTCFGRFVYGQCIEACILGTLCGVGLALFGFPYAAPIGLIVGCTSIVPMIGAWVGGIFGAVMIFSVSPQQTVMFVVFLLVLQQIESNLIYPKVVGTAVNVPGIWVLASVFVGGSLFGVVGILCAVPVVSTVLTLIGDKKDEDKARIDGVEEEDFMIDMRKAAAPAQEERS